MSDTAKKLIGWGLIAVFVLGLWAYVLPPALGGRTIFLTTKGVSMEPLLHENDLAILRKQSSYKVGDIVQYHAESVNAPLLHRIVRIDEDGITTKGDNKDTDDIDHPTPSEIRGKMVDHIAGGGKYVGFVQSTPVRIIGAVLVAWAIYSMIAPQRGKRRPNYPSVKTTRLRGAGGTSGASSDETVGGTPGATHRSLLRMRIPTLKQVSTFGARATFVTITAFSLMVAVIAFSKPTTQTPQQTIYDISGKFDYSARAEQGSLIYRDGQVSTGDPIYHSMVRELFVTYTFELASPARFKGEGDIAMNAVIKGKSGWQHTMALSPAATFMGDTARTSAVVDFKRVGQIAKDIEGLTNVREGGYTLVLKPTINVNGTLGGGKLETSFNPTLTLNSTPTQVNVVEGAGGQQAPSGADTKSLEGINNSDGGTVTIPPGTPAQLKALGLTIGVMALRILGILGTLLGAAGLAASILLTRRAEQVHLDLHGREVHQYGKLLVPVTNVPSNNPVQVPSLSALARIAEQHESLILHRTDDVSETFVVTTVSGTYEYVHSVNTHRFSADEYASSKVGAP